MFRSPPVQYVPGCATDILASRGQRKEVGIEERGRYGGAGTMFDPVPGCSWGPDGIFNEVNDVVRRSFVLADSEFGCKIGDPTRWSGS